MTSHDWTPESIADLRAHWSSGLSTAEIGRRMGISKNAVIGKARRLGLPAREAPANIASPKSRGMVSRPAARSNRELPVSDTRAASPSRRPAATSSGALSSAVERRVSSLPVENLPGAVVAAPPRRVFSGTECQYLYGNDRRAYRFCDAPCVARDNGAPSPYCADHYALCLIPLPKAEAARKAQRAADNAAGRMRWQAPSAWR
jgi:GcrA cell cycle regulator